MPILTKEQIEALREGATREPLKTHVFKPDGVKEVEVYHVEADALLASNAYDLAETALSALERVEKLTRANSESDAACWYHALTWLVGQDGDMEKNVKAKIEELEIELELKK